MALSVFAFGAIWLACLTGAADRSAAAVPSLLTRFPDNADFGAAVGQIRGPRALATDSATGHVFIAESGNSRVSEFDAWGRFVKAFGWDVAPGGVNEQQEIRLRATGGQFRIEFGASTTADLPFDASAAEVEAALDGLPSIGAGGGGVTVTGGPGGTPGTTPSVYTVAFDQGPLQATDVAQLTVKNGTAPLSGGKPAPLLEARTLLNGAGISTGLEACSAESGCQAGADGAGAGQMQNPNGLAIDSSGDLYVLERNNARVQKFNSAGEFVLTLGGEVNKTTTANVCTKAELEGGDVCGIGVKGTANGFFEPPTSFTGDYLTLAPDGTVYVGDKERIQAFEPSGAFKGQVKFADLNAEDVRFPTVGTVAGLAFDGNSGDLYFAPFPTVGTSNPPVFRVDAATGKAVGVLHAEAPENGKVEAIETDPAGDLFAVFDPGPNGLPQFEPRVFEWSSTGEALIGFEDEFAAPTPSKNPPSFLALGTNAAGNLYVAENTGSLSTNAISAYGPPPLGYGPPPKVPPAISEQFAVSVGAVTATLKAKINPRFWADTRYYVEYGLEGCSASTCSAQPTPPGSFLTSQIVSAPLSSAGVVLSGLAPSTTYHYRFVAQSSGGSTLGLSGKTGEEAEGTFTTVPLPVRQPPCPANDAFRPGAAAFLPDCRAYEMVSPVDKNGADISVVLNSPGDPAQFNQAATSGDTLSYSAYRAFGEVESSPYTSQYLAARGGAGWSARQISPPREGASLLPTYGLDAQYKAFSGDLCQGWLLQDSDVPLAVGTVEGWANLYRRDICGEGYEALAPRKAPTLAKVIEFHPEMEGVTSDGAKAFFLANGKLTSNAQAEANQLYEARKGQPLRLVCILPGGTALSGPCSAGTPGASSFKPGRHPDRGAWLPHAVSDDGSVVYWTASEEGPGLLFARTNAADTVEVSSGAAQFWWASADGARALYSEGNALREFVLATESSHEVAQGFKGLLGASEDGTRAYVVSSEALDTGAASGKPNLYLYEVGEPGTFDFIATLDDGDTGAITPVPVNHTAQATPDGDAVAFMSAASLTGADNTDVESGQPDAQVYLYRAASDQLICASCATTGARPIGRNILAGESGVLWASGQIPAAENQLRFPKVISDDGTRLFFESFDALALRDNNGKQDVYEWEAEGSGNCTSSAPGFNAAYTGCVNLISSGESPQDSEIVDASADGRDVFFKTESSLRPEDPGLLDIYDARAAGGFALPPLPPPPCQGEACQHPVAPPIDPTPSSQTFVGPGNRLRCGKGSHRVKKNGKQFCKKNVRKHRKKKHVKKHKRKRQASKQGRAGR